MRFPGAEGETARDEEDERWEEDVELRETEALWHHELLRPSEFLRFLGGMATKMEENKSRKGKETMTLTPWFRPPGEAHAEKKL